jgi:phage gpG-like protein
MPSVDVKFDMSGLIEVIEHLGDRVHTVALPIIGETVVSAVDELIQSEGDTSTEGPWNPFSPITFKIHPRRRGGKLLQDTGLLASIQTKIGPDWVELTSPAPYAAAQANGVDPNPIPGLGPIPARDFFAIDLDAVLEDAAESILEEALR